MKTRYFSVMACALAAMLGTTTPAFATGSSDPTSMAVDVLVARPISLGATILGATLFVVSLPVAAVSRSVKSTSETLVAAPARDLFTRPVGDLQDWLNY